jgi:hypothetical protein
MIKAPRLDLVFSVVKHRADEVLRLATGVYEARAVEVALLAQGWLGVGKGGLVQLSDVVDDLIRWHM